MKTVLNSEPLGYSKKAELAWKQKGYIYCNSSWDIIDNTREFPEVEVLIVRLMRYVDSNILDKFKNLKYLISATTGHDHIDLNAIEERNVKLISLQGQNEFLQTIPSTAEHTWALLMSLIRNIPNANRDVENGNWNRDEFRGFQLKNKVLGIVGFGRTGQAVSKYAHAFGMNVCYFDPYQKKDKVRKIDSLIGLFEVADIISFHVHLNDDTHNMINSENSTHIKNGAYLINTSRGKIWDENIVKEMLLSKQVNGVATDVLSTELDNIELSPLWKAQKDNLNVIITPHIGGATWDAMWQCEEFIISLL